MKAVIEAAPWELWSKQRAIICRGLCSPFTILDTGWFPTPLLYFILLLLKMVRMPSDDPSPVYTPHESAVVLTTPDVNP